VGYVYSRGQEVRAGKIFRIGSLMIIVLFAVENDASNARGAATSVTMTVNSVLDSSDNNIGDDLCDDGAGNCTLRAAIEESNSHPEEHTILFNIAGSGVRTLRPLTPLPSLTETITINGYSQPGAQPNTAIAPRPFNGTLLIEINGTDSIIPNSSGISIAASNVVVRGLVVNSFNFDGFNVDGDHNTIAGNYIGTDPSGLLDQGNSQRGVGSGPTHSNNLLIGGLAPQDRNIVSGNENAGISPNIGHKNWTVQGNYIGIGSDGLTSIGNSTYGEQGGLSLDNDNGHVVGGSQQGATNVISGNNSFGIFPDNSSGLIIQGNIIGPDWKGDPLLNNPQLGGIGLPPLAGPISQVLIGGTTHSAANLIAYNNGTGIAILSSTRANQVLYQSNDIAVLGNRIFGNRPEGSYPLSQTALGIDLLSMNLPEFTITNRGTNLNDPTDADDGANQYMNYPILRSVQQKGQQLLIDFSLDAAGSNVGDRYRIEFFANDDPDETGYIGNQRYLGFINSTNSTGKQITLLLPPGTDLTGTDLSATTTSLVSTNAIGFGATSEFAPNVSIDVVHPTDGELPNTGIKFLTLIEKIAIFWLTLGLFFIFLSLTYARLLHDEKN